MPKFRNFQKSRFLGGPEWVFRFEASKMILYMIIYYFWRFEGQKMPFFKKNYVLILSFLNFSGALGVPPVKFVLPKMVPKGQSHLRLNRVKLN